MSVRVHVTYHNLNQERETLMFPDEFPLIKYWHVLGDQVGREYLKSIDTLWVGEAQAEVEDLIETFEKCQLYLSDTSQTQIPKNEAQRMFSQIERVLPLLRTARTHWELVKEVAIH